MRWKSVKKKHRVAVCQQPSDEIKCSHTGQEHYQILAEVKECKQPQDLAELPFNAFSHTRHPSIELLFVGCDVGTSEWT